MRKNQLEFKLKEFGKNEQNTYKGYIDANKPEELLHEILVEFHKIMEMILILMSSAKKQYILMK